MRYHALILPRDPVPWKTQWEKIKRAQGRPSWVAIRIFGSRTVQGRRWGFAYRGVGGWELPIPELVVGRLPIGERGVGALAKYRRAGALWEAASTV